MTDMSASYGMWLILGVALMLAELALPGFISLFLGASACLVGLLIWCGLIKSGEQALIAWPVLSIFLILTLRSSLLRLFPGDTSVGSVDDDANERGQIVLAVSDIGGAGAEGQIDFRDTLWLARSVGELITKGTKVQLVERHGLIWIVKRVDE